MLKLLGLETLAKEIAELKKFQRDLATAQEGLSAKVDEVSEKVDDMEEFDSSQFVSEDDVNDRIESYLSDNDYVSSSYVDDVIENKVSDAIDDADIESKIESAIEDAGIEEQVRDLFNNASPAPMSVEDIKKEVSEAVKVTLERMVKALADQQ